MSQSSYPALLPLAASLFQSTFAGARPAGSVFAPGRVNLIGEHIDYHNLSVLPMAIAPGVCIAYRARSGRGVSAVSDVPGLSPATFDLDSIDKAGSSPGDWANYLKAAALAAQVAFQIPFGIDAAIVSDLPVAAGLSSSSALLVAFTLALLAANHISPDLAALMRVLPEGEQFVGTRGGGMDHAAILASRQGCATFLRFHPFLVSHVAIPRDWRFVVADSLHAAEKSAGLVDEYNQRRYAGNRALRTLGFASYQDALHAALPECLALLHYPQERNAFRHVAGEAGRVHQAVAALQAADLSTFGALLSESHASLRDCLHVSSPALDALVATAIDAGAAGARLTGAGFGGCIVAVCHQSAVDRLHATLKLRHYAHLAPSRLHRHLFVAEAAAGALEILDG